MTIEELRQQIDQLDERLVELLSQRAHCALEIGKLKHTLGVEVYQPERESQVLHHVRSHGAQTGSPMTYVLNGKQYIVVAVSSLTMPGELIAYALP